MQRKPNGLSFLVKGVILPSLHPMYQLYQRKMEKPDKTIFLQSIHYQFCIVRM